MDILDTIEMCKKSLEIQSSWTNPEVGDYIYIELAQGFSFRLERSIFGYKWKRRKKFIETKCRAIVTKTNGYSTSMNGFENDKMVEFYVPYASSWIFTNDAIWLPSQDQLKQMIKSKDVGELLGKFDYWWHENLGIRSDSWRSEEGTKSLDQLWLAFVMKEKYNK